MYSRCCRPIDQSTQDPKARPGPTCRRRALGAAVTLADPGSRMLLPADLRVSVHHSGWQCSCSRRVARAFGSVVSVSRFQVGPRPRLQPEASSAALAAGVTVAALGPPVSPGPTDFHFQMPLQVRIRSSEHAPANPSVAAASNAPNGTARRAVAASGRRRPGGHCRWCLLPVAAEDPAGSRARRRRQPEPRRQEAAKFPQAPLTPLPHWQAPTPRQADTAGRER